MMRIFLVLLFILIGGLSRASSCDTLSLRSETLGNSMADRACYLTDPGGSFTAASFLQDASEHRFRPVENPRQNFGFTDATHWVRVTVKNQFHERQELLLEASRSITNEVTLYVIDAGRIVDTMRTGDHRAFGERPFASRKNIFPLSFGEGEELQLLFRIESHGESLVFPLIPWSREGFYDHNSLEQWHDGFFYGIFFFVFLIFGFFYRVLKDPSFLYYVLYIFCFGILQFSIDGYSYRFFFGNSPWMADRIILFSSALTILLLALYARSYLKVPLRSPKLDRVFKGVMGLALFLFVISFFPLSVSKYCNPALNSFSFLAVIFVLSSILFLRKRGYGISHYFLGAYVLLISGAIVFILGNTGVLESSPLTLNALKYGGLGEVILLSFSMAEKYRSIQREKEFAQEESLRQMEELNRVKDEYNRELEQEVGQRTRDLEREREKLDSINREMMSSIRYAERIQRAVLPPQSKFDELFREHFVLFLPRDIVSGDIYWCSAVNEERGLAPGQEADTELPFSGLSNDPVSPEARYRVFSVMDCTGHGVPGAFLTFLGQSFLAQAKKELSVHSPASVLSFIDRELKATLSEIGSETQVRDGMDMGLCVLDTETRELVFAGAGHDCYIVRDGEERVLKGDRKGIGGEEGSKGFEDHRMQLRSGDTIYLFSDGYPDQFGGPNNKKFKYRPFRELLTSLTELPLVQQREELDRTFHEWKGDLEQVDDICVMGIRVR